MQNYAFTVITDCYMYQYRFLVSCKTPNDYARRAGIPADPRFHGPLTNLSVERRSDDLSENGDRKGIEDRTVCEMNTRQGR